MMTAVQQAGPSRTDVERWYREYRVELTRLAYLAIGDNEAAQDAVQEAFVALHLRAERVREPIAFLRAAVLNQCRTSIRRAQARPRVERWRRLLPAASTATSCESRHRLCCRL